jgi:hypothetical protein
MLRLWRTIALPVALSVGLATALPDQAAAPASLSPPRLPNLPVADTQSSRPAPDRTGAHVAASAIVPGSVNRSSINLRATYDVSVWLSYASRQLAVDSRMTVTNTSGVSIDRLELNTIASRLGGLRIRSVTVDGHAVTAKTTDQTLVVPLGGVLPAGASTHVRVRTRSWLRTSLSGSSWMYTKANGVLSAYRWLPWISRPVPFNRPNHGDPFITPVSPEVRVKVTTDRTMVIASTGDRIGHSGLSQTFLARNVRDFTLTASPFYRTGSVTYGSKVIRVYYRSGAPATAMLSAARRAISRYSGLLDASYPYATYKVVQSAGGYGMESPGLTWIPTGVGRTNVTYLVYHETAHQWFYSLVGGNQAYEPYTDEAAADFLARNALGLRRGSRCSTARLDLSIYRYSSSCYYEVIYIQGGNFLDDLRRRMGSTAFWRGLRAYVDANRWKIAPTKRLLDTLDDATSLNLVPRYEPRFPRLY